MDPRPLPKMNDLISSLATKQWKLEDLQMVIDADKQGIMIDAIMRKCHSVVSHVAACLDLSFELLNDVYLGKATLTPFQAENLALLYLMAMEED